MGRILEPLLWRNQRQTHSAPTQTANEIDFDMASDEAILLLAHEVALENPVPAVDALGAAGISVDPDTTPASLALFAGDNDTVSLFVFETQITTTGQAALRGHDRKNFPDPGLLIIDNPSVHFITEGASVTRAVLHTIWYKIVRLTDLETAGLIIRRRRQ